MAYHNFSIRKVRQDFSLTLIEGRFLPEIEPILPTPSLQAFLDESIPLAIATGSEKARSEGIIYPILMEVRRILGRKVSLFSGEEFTVEPEAGLNGVCDFLMSRSPQQFDIEAPVVMITEAKKADLKSGMGQCIAEMVAALRFNQSSNSSISRVYGCITNGKQWRFLRLCRTDQVTIDITDYSLHPVEMILGMLVWLVWEG